MVKQKTFISKDYELTKLICSLVSDKNHKLNLNFKT